MGVLAPGSQRALGLCEVSNLSPVWDLNFPRAAPSLGRWGREVKAVLPAPLSSFFLSGREQLRGKVCYLRLLSVPEMRLEGALPGGGGGVGRNRKGRARSSGSRLPLCP